VDVTSGSDYVVFIFL